MSTVTNKPGYIALNLLFLIVCRFLSDFGPCIKINIHGFVYTVDKTIDYLNHVRLAKVSMQMQDRNYVGFFFIMERNC